jgi:hypothetical protein
MTRRKDILNSVEIKSPCTANWNEMKGTDQIRYCFECNKYVYNLSEMTRRDAEAILLSRDDQMCARLIRDLEGQTLTVDSLPPVRLLGWKPGRVANAVVSALISITPAALPLANGQVTSPPGKSQDGSGHKSHRTVPASTTSAITGIVSNETGAAMSGALVTLTSEASGEVLSQLTSQEGEYRFDGLAARTYIVEIQAKDYEAVKNHDVSLQPGEARRLDVGLERLFIVSGAISRPAQPLRTLYSESDRVVVAEVGKSTATEQKGQIKTLLSVSQTIKGDGHKPIIAVYRWSYNGERLIEGQTVLAFMQRRGDAAGANDLYDLINGETSVKHLSQADLETYLQRIQELKEITGKNEAAPSDIVEWLVRCAEDPVTRREGAFELYASALREQYEKELAQTERGELLNSLRRMAHRQEQQLAALLTEEQKQRLMNVLLKSEDLGGVGDFELLELVRRWNDPRLLPFLMSHLHRFEATAPDYLWRLLQTVGDLLDDKTLLAISQHYQTNKPFNGLEADQDENAIADSDEDEEVESNEDDEVESDEEDDTTEDETTDTSDAATRLTPEAAQQIRVELLKRFIAVAEAKMKLVSAK